MRKVLLLLVSALALVGVSVPAFAIQCVPYAREVSGINLKGDAWQWWHAAAGLYDRGRTPREGSVLVFSRQGSMRHGHVSVVTRVVSSRLVLVDHANWAPARTSGRGEVATAVPVLDVSPRNDWSQVRVWFHPAKDFGNRVYRTEGFVYQPRNGGAKRPAIHQAALSRAEQMFPSAKPHAPARVEAAVVKAEPKGEETATTVPDRVHAEAEPAAAIHGAEGMVKVARHVFRPRRPAVSGDTSPALDALLFN